MRFQRNYYEVFGVAPTAGRIEIKERYLELVRRYHPDRSRDKAPAERLLTQINIAYQTLRDTEKRAAYDLLHLKRDVARHRNQAASANPTDKAATISPVDSPPKPMLDPTDALKQAHSAYLRGDRTEAQRYCEEIIKSLPAEPQALQLLGDIYGDQGKRVESLAAYNAALITHPKSRLLLGKIQRMEDALAAAAKWEASRPAAPATPAKSAPPKAAAKSPARKPLFQLTKKSR